MNNALYVLLFIVSILISSYSQILLKKGASKENIYINKYTIIGYSIMLSATFLTLFAYKYVNLSFAEVLQALSFVFVVILSRIFLKERINKRTILGCCLIILGIVVFKL